MSKEPIPVLRKVTAPGLLARKEKGEKFSVVTACDFPSARAAEEAGCFAVVLEAIPARLAALVTRSLSVPTVGIGAGVACDAQVLVSHDLLGLSPDAVPRFVKQYESLYGRMVGALRAYREDVVSGAFPEPVHEREMPDAEWDAFQEGLDEQPRASVSAPAPHALPGRAGSRGAEAGRWMRLV